MSCMGEIINAYQILVRKPEGKILVGWPRMADHGQGGSLSGLGSVIGCCECGNELLGSTKSGKLLEYRHDY